MEGLMEPTSVHRNFYIGMPASNVFEIFLLSYKRGKFVENPFGNFSSSYSRSPAATNGAVATKNMLAICQEANLTFSVKFRGQLLIQKTESGTRRKLSTKVNGSTFVRRHSTMLSVHL